MNLAEKLMEYLDGKGYQSDNISKNYTVAGITFDIAIKHFYPKKEIENPYKLSELYLSKDRREKLDNEEIIEKIRSLNKTRSIVPNINIYEVELIGEKLKITPIYPIIENIGTFIEHVISPMDSNSPMISFFRGHSSADYKLLPSIYRPVKNGGKTIFWQITETGYVCIPYKEYIYREDRFFKEAIRRCPQEFNNHTSTFDQLVKMQHYEVPTRLLDITTNPLVALYFASQNDDIDGEIYQFEINEAAIKYFDSDAVSVVANIARRPYYFEIPVEFANDKKKFNKTEDIAYLLHEIKVEKPHFMDVIDPADLERVFCVWPKLNNPRIIRQQGAFFLFGIDKVKTKPAKFKFNIRRFIIPSAIKKSIRQDLKKLGIDEANIFPELDKVAEELQEQ